MQTPEVWEQKWFSEQTRHIKAYHIKLCPVILVTGLPGRVSGQRDLCCLSPEDRTCIFDPGAHHRKTAPHQEGSPANNIHVYVPFSLLDGDKSALVVVGF